MNFFASAFVIISVANAFNNAPHRMQKIIRTSLSMNLEGSDSQSRREVFGKVAGAVFLSSSVLSTSGQNAWAVPTEETQRVTTRMGGLMEVYKDVNRGWTINCPSGWNKFEGEVGAYDVKWQDLVDPTANIKVSSNPVKSTTTSIDALGEIGPLGESLAEKRNAKLIRSEERLTDSILFYTFEFAISDGTHQLLSLSVNKGRVWSLDASSKESKWGKSKELYYNVIRSFTPKLV